MNKFFITTILLVGFFSFLIYDTFVKTTTTHENSIFAFTESQNKRDLLVNDIKIINTLEKHETSPQSESVSQSDLDIPEKVNFVIAQGAVSLSIKEIDQIKESSKNKKGEYQDYITLKWSEFYTQKNWMALKHLCDFASLLPIQLPQMAREAEDLLISLSKSEMEWNDELFRSSLQLYLIQMKFSDSDTNDFIEQLKQNAKNNQLNNNVQSAINAIKI